MILHGKNLQILKLTGSTYAAVVAMAKSCDVSVDGDQIETSSPSDGQWRHYIAGRKGWSISVGYLMSVGTFPTEAEMVNTTITIRVSDGTAQMQGTAIVKTWKATGNIGNLANGSFVFLGTGALAPVTTE